MTLGGAKVVITGAAGMLGAEIVPRFEQLGVPLVLTDVRNDSYRRLDITDAEATESFIASERPSWILNCAAYTKVDDAEREYDMCFAINAIGPYNLAQAAKKSGARLLHISSDYVFGKYTGPREPIAETTPAHACGIYGHSKRFGDDLVLQTLPHHGLVVRTSWLHGVHGPNFIDTILRVTKEKEEIAVVNDQFGSPTWAGWLAEVLIKLLQRGAFGLYHASSRGGISWYDFAKEICAQAGRATTVKTQTTEELGRPAPRPPYSVLSVEKLENFLGEEVISWQDCVRRHLADKRSLEESL